MENIIFKHVIGEVLKALRGKRSQEALNRKFGFSFNQLYRWERGVTKISWPEFVQLCQFCHVPLLATMQALFKGSIDMTTGLQANPLESSYLIKSLIGSMAVDKFSSRYQFSRKTVLKWLSGQAHPTLEQMFFLFHNHSGQLIKLLSRLTGEENIPSIHGVIRKLKMREEITYKYPEVSLILNTMHTKGFKRKTEFQQGYFAKKFDLTLAEEEEILEALLQSDTIHKAGASFGINKYDVFRVNATVEQSSKRYMHYFRLISKAIERGELRAPQNYFAHMVFPSNIKQVQKLKKILINATNESVKPIAEEQDLEDFDKLMLLTIALCQVD